MGAQTGKTPGSLLFSSNNDHDPGCFSFPLVLFSHFSSTFATKQSLTSVQINIKGLFYVKHYKILCLPFTEYVPLRSKSVCPNRYIVVYCREYETIIVHYGSLREASYFRRLEQRLKPDLFELHYLYY